MSSSALLSQHAHNSPVNGVRGVQLNRHTLHLFQRCALLFPNVDALDVKFFLRWSDVNMNVESVEWWARLNHSPLQWIYM